MAMTRQTYKHDCMIFRTINELVPEDHLVRAIDAYMDFTFIEDEVKDLYSKVGRASIPPIVLFKLLMINKIFGINSMRRTCEECKVNLAYRWFLGLSMEDDIPNYSTWCQNYRRRYKDSDIFEKIFKRILKQAMEYGYVDMEAVYYDGTHQKANANKRKCTDEEVEIEAKSYEKELLEEINSVRKEHGQKPIKAVESTELDFDENGEEVVKTKTKHVKVSTTDPESGDYHKGEHERCYAYTHNTCCDKNGYVIDHETTPGNVHDSVSLEAVRKRVIEEYGKDITYEVLDAGYKTPNICKEIIEDGKTPLMPYTRGKGSKELFKKKEFIYNSEEDTYTCPNGETLSYTTVDKQGYKKYQCGKKICDACPLKEKCTKSKTTGKIVTRHVWQNYVDNVENLRYTDIWKEIYPTRKETIERVFADCKEKHCLRYTRVKGLDKNRNNTSMIFACHNLKKMALWKRNSKNNTSNKAGIIPIFQNFKNLVLKKSYSC